MPIVEIWGLVLVFAVVKVPLVACLTIHMLSLNSLMVRFDMQKYFASSWILQDRCFPMLARQTSSHHLDQIYLRGRSSTTKGVRIFVLGTFIWVFPSKYICTIPTTLSMKPNTSVHIQTSRIQTTNHPTWDTWFEPLLCLYVTGTVIACGWQSQEELSERMFKIGRATEEILSRASLLPSCRKDFDASLLVLDNKEYYPREPSSTHPCLYSEWLYTPAVKTTCRSWRIVSFSGHRDHLRFSSDQQQQRITISSIHDRFSGNGGNKGQRWFFGE
jgi:hypothetical protein